MHFMLFVDTTFADYIPVIIQIIVSAGVIFGGTGFWQWKQDKDRAKRDAISKESGVEKKVDTLSQDVALLAEKVDTISEGMQEIKRDIILLQQASDETKKYREIRDKQDRDAAVIQRAIIQSLVGILRERLLENYKKCIRKGYYTKEEREVYGKMFECYTQDPFNGNGVMHDLQPIMKALPWTKEEAKPQEVGDE